MSDTQRQILDMLADGKINIDEAERLLKALGKLDISQQAISSATARVESGGPG